MDIMDIYDTLDIIYIYIETELYLSIGEGHDNPLQYSCLENSIDREAWQVMVHRIAETDMTK